MRAIAYNEQAEYMSTIWNAQMRKFRTIRTRNARDNFKFTNEMKRYIVVCVQQFAHKFHKNQFVPLCTGVNGIRCRFIRTLWCAHHMNPVLRMSSAWCCMSLIAFWYATHFVHKDGASSYTRTCCQRQGFCSPRSSHQRWQTKAMKASSFSFH